MLETLTKQQWTLTSKYLKNPDKFKKDADLYKKVIEFISANYAEGRDFSEQAAMYRNGINVVPRCKCGAKVKFKLGNYTWAKTCGQACYLSDICVGAKRVTVHGVEYKTFSLAAKAYDGLLYEAIYDPNVTDVFYTENHIDNCRKNLSKSHEKLLDAEWLRDKKKQRVSIKQISIELNVSRECVNNAFIFHDIPRVFDQLPPIAKSILADAELFKAEFDLLGSESMAIKYQCSPSTILTRAHELGCNMRRFTSYIETAIKSFLETHGYEVLQSDRKTIAPRDLDLVIPEKRIAVELDGLFWHSEWAGDKSDRNKHKIKYDLCNNAGYTLLRFTDVETTHKLDIVKSMLLSKLGASEKLYARKYKVKQVSGTDAKRFFDANHLSGHAAAGVAFGLYHEEKLIMCMSFAKPRFSKQYDWEVVRMASTLGHTVVGGGSRLLAAFRSANAGSIMSYSDNRTGSGESYRKMGFELVKETEPGYVYYKKEKVYSRYMFQKSRIAKMCAVYDPEETEQLNAEVNGYGRYWDCGNKVWLLK